MSAISKYSIITALFPEYLYNNEVVGDISESDRVTFHGHC